MKVLFNLNLFFIVGLSLFTCKSQKAIEDKVTVANQNTTTQPRPKVVSTAVESELISMEKGACHGSCPIYQLTIFNNGKCEFNGKRFCKKLGAFTANLSEVELNFLLQKIAQLDMNAYPERIESLVPDFPSTEITSQSDEGVKSVWWRDGAPGELEEMAVILDKFRQELSWEFDVNAPLPAGTIENEMLIQLKEGIKATDFATEYNKYKFTPVKELVPDQNYWLFRFDTKIISGIEMLNLLNKSEKIHNAEFNKELEQRH